MAWYQWLSLGSLVICTLSLLYHIVRLVRKGNPEDFATPAGSGAAGIRYAFTGAMSPKKKESAYLHLPTYTAGLIYHLGTFISLLLYIIFLFIPHLNPLLLSILLSLSLLSGVAILVKRVYKRLLRRLSNPDDYLSNLLVTLFQATTIAYLLLSGNPENRASDPTALVYHLSAGLLFLYMPLGKLKHLVYFFAARYHLGWFYGRRGVWR